MGVTAVVGLAPGMFSVPGYPLTAIQPHSQQYRIVAAPRQVLIASATLRSASRFRSFASAAAAL